MVKIIIPLILMFLTLTSYAKIPSASKKTLAPNALNGRQMELLRKYMLVNPKKEELLKLKKETLSMGGQAIPTIVRVMKSNKFPEKNRWVATFLLGRIMGSKSAPFISKFLDHPSWVMRMASLKTLLALKQKNYGNLFAERLMDSSYIVRVQALENIRSMNLRQYSSSVWAMLYDKKNYYQSDAKSKDKKSKRANIIKKIVTTVGDLRFQKAQKPMLKMILKDKYVDIFDELDYALGKIVGKQSPKGDIKVKKHFWKRYSMSEQVI